MLTKKDLPLHITTTCQEQDIACAYTKHGHGVFRVTDKKMCESVIHAANNYHALQDVCDMLEKAIPLLQKNALDNCDCDFEVPKITLCEHCKLSYGAGVALFMATGRSIDSGEALLATHTQEEAK